MKDNVVVDSHSHIGKDIFHGYAFIDDYIKFIDLCFYEAIENKLTIYIKEKVDNNAYSLFENIDNNIKLLYYNNGIYN